MICFRSIDVQVYVIVGRLQLNLVELLQGIPQVRNVTFLSQLINYPASQQNRMTTPATKYRHDIDIRSDSIKHLLEQCSIRAWIVDILNEAGVSFRDILQTQPDGKGSSLFHLFIHNETDPGSLIKCGIKPFVYNHQDRATSRL